MADITPILTQEYIDETFEKLNTNDDNLNDQLEKHVDGIEDLHSANDIIDDSGVTVARVKDALESLQQQITDATIGAGTSPAEVTLARTSNVYGTFASLKERDDNGDIRLQDLGYNVKGFGAVGDGVVDDTLAIQNAIDASDNVYFPSGTYRVTSPIYLNPNKSIVGENVITTTIIKDTNTLGVGSNVFSGVTDSYVKDAVIIIKHADNEFTNYINIENLVIKSDVSEYIIYAPRMAVSNLTNVLLVLKLGLYGFYTNRSYMMNFTDFQVSASYGNVVGSIGVYFDDLGTGASGTSCNFTRCWVRDGFYTAYKFTGLIYSNMNACGTDKWRNTALYMDTCDINIGSLGAEEKLGDVGDAIVSRYSRVSIGTLVMFSVETADGNYLINHQGGQLIVNTIRHTCNGVTGSPLRIADNATFITSSFSVSTNIIGNAISRDSTSKRIDLSKEQFNNPIANKYTVSSVGSVKDLYGSSLEVRSLGSLYLSSGDALTMYLTNTIFRPVVDNVVGLGDASHRFKNIYASTGVVNTSDLNEKTKIESLDDKEKLVGVKLKTLIKKFKFKDAIVLKGSDARIHTGVIAQEVKLAFEEEGLIAEEYGLLCKDEWEEDGIIKEKYGIRYEELLCFIISSL